jgi:S-formylglutathione hydrolase FrmB
MKQLFLLVISAVLALTGSAATVDTLAIEAVHVQSPYKTVVITPDAAKANPAAKFPTVYLLNGYSGDYKSWITLRDDLPELADRYGMVIVTPDGRDSWYWDSPRNVDMQMETFITTELVPYIDNHYPTKAQPEFRAITGLSMGGHGGLWLGIRHSDIFGSAGSTSGGVNIIPFPKNWKMADQLGDYESNKEAWRDHTVINLVPQLKPGQLNIIFDCGVDDFFFEVNNELHQALLDAKIPHDYITRPGAHTAQYWRNSILYQLLYFNEIFTR